MVGLSPELVAIQAIGTDGEKQLGEGFKLQFRSAIHLLCFIHMKDCIVRKLRDIGVCGDSMKPFVNEIFGEQHGTHLFTGLVDSESPDDFDKRLMSLESQWNERECKIRSSNKPIFYDWFIKYHGADFKEHMLKSVRVKAGLGDPPVAYTNNANESANARIKAKVDYKKSDLKLFCNEMKELVERQFRDVERAFTLDAGPYEVAPDYVVHKENATKWVKRSMQYKQRVVNSLYKLPLVYHVPSVSISDTSVSSGSEDFTVNEECLPLTKPLSISWKDAKLSRDLFEGMWTKASKLLAMSNSITPAPGLESSKMVSSFSNPRKPHLVTFYKNGKIICDCQNCSIKHICAHILATAETIGILEDFLKWFKKEKSNVNLWELSRSSGVPKNPGSKPKSRKRSRNVLPQVKTTSEKVCKQSLSTSPLQLEHSSSPQPQQESSTPLQTQKENYATWYPPYHTPSPYTPYYGMHYGDPSFYHPPPYLPPSPNPSAFFHPPAFRFQPGTSFHSQPQNYSPSGPMTSPYSTPTLTRPDSSKTLQTVYESSSSEHPFTVKKMNARIKKCQGCKQEFQDSSTNTLIVSRLERRPFVAPDGSVKVPASAKNSHYHLSMNCLTNADPSFLPQNLQLPNELKAVLSVEQLSILAKFGVDVNC